MAREVSSNGWTTKNGNYATSYQLPSKVYHTRQLPFIIGLDWLETISALNAPLRFGNRRQINALKAYNVLEKWREGD